MHTHLHTHPHTGTYTLYTHLYTNLEALVARQVDRCNGDSTSLPRVHSGPGSSDSEHVGSDLIPWNQVERYPVIHPTCI